MPEGDTIHGAADRLGDVLTGTTIVRAHGSHRAMIEFGRRIEDCEVLEATAHGKHLLLHFSNDWTLRTHLQMTGSWHIYKPGEKWRKTPGKARVVLETAQHVAVCFAAPTVQLAPRRLVRERIQSLGPDLMTEIDVAAVVARLYSMAAEETICHAIVDQNVMAGIGNVYKSELLFLEGIHPDRFVREVASEQAAKLVDRAHRLLAANRGRSRTTTGVRSPGRSTWVYGRAGLPCRRCATSIAGGRRGPMARSTYWCPQCQPMESDRKEGTPPA